MLDGSPGNANLKNLVPPAPKAQLGTASSKAASRFSIPSAFIPSCFMYSRESLRFCLKETPDRTTSSFRERLISRYQSTLITLTLLPVLVRKVKNIAGRYSELIRPPLDVCKDLLQLFEKKLSSHHRIDHSLVSGEAELLRRALANRFSRSKSTRLDSSKLITAEFSSASNSGRRNFLIRNFSFTALSRF